MSRYAGYDVHITRAAAWQSRQRYIRQYGDKIIKTVMLLTKMLGKYQLIHWNWQGGWSGQTNVVGEPIYSKKGDTVRKWIELAEQSFDAGQLKTAGRQLAKAYRLTMSE